MEQCDNYHFTLDLKGNIAEYDDTLAKKEGNNKALFIYFERHSTLKLAVRKPSIETPQTAIIATQQ